MPRESRPLAAPGQRDAYERDLTFLGMAGMIDPPRPSAREAVARCRRAGIKPVMITGDHRLTASAIARDLGILEKQDRVVTGQDLSAMDDARLREEVRDIAVYARVSPEHKVRIVKAWQSWGDVVAMTGDGVNDAPALMRADIGVAMGLGGTEVSKEAAAMILTDDNFATIVDAVAQGRVLYMNISQGNSVLLSSNPGEVCSSSWPRCSTWARRCCPFTSSGEPDYRQPARAGAGQRACRARRDGPAAARSPLPHLHPPPAFARALSGRPDRGALPCRLPLGSPREP